MFGSNFTETDVMCIVHALIIFQYTNHRTLDPPITQYTLESLYPNSLYHVWVAAKSKRGEGATTPSLSARTEQYCKYLFSKHLEKNMIYRWR